jgi:hypothetical protein
MLEGCEKGRDTEGLKAEEKWKKKTIWEMEGG